MSKISPAQIHHFVLFWLKPTLNNVEISEFASFFEELKKIDYINTLAYGRSADTPSRTVIDNSFSYSLSIVFNSIEDHNAYQEDQQHIDAIAKYAHYWEKVVVHDSAICSR